MKYFFNNRPWSIWISQWKIYWPECPSVPGYHLFPEIDNIPGILLSIDFEKAFNSLNWNFPINTLKHVNFGPTFTYLIKLIYNNIESAVLNNGSTCNYFKLERGIRQGCPLSAYLFILSIEVLANNIRNNKRHKRDNYRQYRN